MIAAPFVNDIKHCGGADGKSPDDFISDLVSIKNTTDVLEAQASLLSLEDKDTVSDVTSSTSKQKT